MGFEFLWHWTEKAGKIYRSKIKYFDALDLHVPLLDIHPEGKLQREIRDIIDELDMMIHVSKKQKEVIKRFSKHVEHILNPKGLLQTNFGRATEPWASPRSSRSEEWRDISTERRQERAASPSNDHQGGNYDELRAQQFMSFHVQYQELLEEVNGRMEELEDLKRNAESTAQSVSTEYLPTRASGRLRDGC